MPPLRIPADSDTRSCARQALACLDLTSLDDGDDVAAVARLCARAQGRHGPVAAVCVWPSLAGDARRLVAAGIRVAAVANFPDGGDDGQHIAAQIATIAGTGADEVDLVLPYRRLMAGDADGVRDLLLAARRASAALTLKVILETGELHSPELIRRAAVLALDAGADFIKTSTGKTAVGATEEAAHVMLQAIAAHPRAAATAGIKVSGGVRTVAQAGRYMALVSEVLGGRALCPARFRIGASGLLDDIERELDGATGANLASTNSY